jgi:hypothetical protein
LASSAEQLQSECVVGEHPLAHRIPINPLRIGAQDAKIPALSFPYTNHSSTDHCEQRANNFSSEHIPLLQKIQNLPVDLGAK